LRLLSSLILILVIAGMALASQILDPTDIGVGARPLGLGKAFTAIADDGSAIFTNPAGLALSNKLKMVSMGGNLMGEVPYTMMGGSYPVMNGTLGVGYVGLGVSGIKETKLVGITPEVTGQEGSFANTALCLAYAGDLEKIPYLSRVNTGIFKETKLGCALKLISHGYSGATTFEGGKATGFDLDVGAISKLDEETQVGMSIKNIIPGNNFKSDELPMVITAGLSKRFSKYNLLTALDAEISRTLLLHLGCEWNPIQIFKLRFGLDQKPSAGGTLTNLAAGVGLGFKGFTFDYAYHTYAELSEFTTHFLSIGYMGEALDQARAKGKDKVAPPSPPAPVIETPAIAPQIKVAPITIKALPKPKPQPKLKPKKKGK